MTINMKKLTDEEVASIMQKLKGRKPDKEFMGHPERNPPVPHPVKIYYIDDLQVWNISDLTFMFLPKDMSIEQILGLISTELDKLNKRDGQPGEVERLPESADLGMVKENLL